MELKTVREITETGIYSESERAWAETMGTDYRRAWETAPSMGALCFLAAALATTPGHRRFVATLLSVAGGDGSQLDVLHDALHAESAPRREAAMAFLNDLPGLDRPDHELVQLVRARISYESLTEG